MFASLPFNLRTRISVCPERLLLLYSAPLRSFALTRLSDLLDAWLTCHSSPSPGATATFLTARRRFLGPLSLLRACGFCARRLSSHCYQLAWTTPVLALQRARLASFNQGKPVTRQIYLDLPTLLSPAYLPASCPASQDPAVLTDLATRWSYWPERIADVLGASPAVSQYNRPANHRLPMAPAGQWFAPAASNSQADPVPCNCDPRHRFSRAGRNFK